MAAIARRLRRCHTTSLYRSEEGLTWGALYDHRSGEELDVQMTVAQELPVTRCAIQRARAQIAYADGDAATLQLCRRRMHELKAHLGSTDTRETTLLVRAQSSYARTLRRAAIVRLTVIALVGVATLIAEAPSWLVAAALLPLLFVALRSLRRSLFRTDRLLAAHAFERP